jgi:hypothetical protein
MVSQTSCVLVSGGGGRCAFSKRKNFVRVILSVSDAENDILFVNYSNKVITNIDTMCSSV